MSSLSTPSSVTLHHSRYRSEKRVERERQLEDYLDTNLLSAIRAEIRAKRERDGEKMIKENGFNWPVNELKPLVDGAVAINGAVDTMTGSNCVFNGVDDVDGRFDLFGRFEETALKRLKG